MTCQVCYEARRYAKTSEPYETARERLAALEGKTVTKDLVEEFLDVIRSAEEDALRAWLEVERLDDEGNHSDQIDTEEDDV
jgi:hypothetical protein